MTDTLEEPSAGFLTEYDGVDRIFITPDKKWWVDIRKCLTDEETQKVSKQMMRHLLQAKNASELEDLDEDAAKKLAMNPELLQENQRMSVVLSIIDWNLTDSAGEVLPHGTPEEIAASLVRLPGFATNLLTQEVVARNTVTREEAKRFPAGGDGSSEVGLDYKPNGSEVLG